MTIDLSHESMRRAMGDLDRASHELADMRRSAEGSVDGFLQSGWTGVAAQAFSEAWEDWKASAVQVQDGLSAMSDLVKAVHVDFLHQDKQSQQELDAISRHVIERLG